MKKIIFCFLLINAFLNAQNLDWVRTTGASGGVVYGYANCIDEQQNVYSTGTFSGTVDMDPGPGVVNLTSTNSSLYVQKLDASGNLAWAKAINCSLGYFGSSLSNAITVDGSGNVYFIAQLGGTVDADPGPATVTVAVSNSDPKVLLIKLDASGNYVYSKLFDTGFTPTNLLYSNNFMYVSGYFLQQTNIDFDVNSGVSTYYASSTGGFIQKLDLSWNLLWTKPFAPLPVWPVFDVDNNGNIYLGGIFSGSVDFDPGAGATVLTVDGSISSTFYDIYLVKLNSSGSMVWAKQITSSASESFATLTVDKSNGDFYIAGHKATSTDFDPGPGTAFIPGPNSSFIAKYDQNGNFMRGFATAQQLSGGISTSYIDMNVDVAKNLIAVGRYSNPFDADPGPGTYMLNGSTGSVYLIKYDVAGNFVWAGSVGGSSVVLAGADVDGDGNIYYGGYIDGATNFDPFGGSAFVATQGTRDAFVSRIKGCAHNAPDICLVTVDSLANNNVIYFDKSLYPQADSFVIFRYDAFTTNYLQVGAVAASDPDNFLVDTARTVGGPNGGDPQYSSYKYKMAIRDLCGTLGTKGLYHESIFIQQNFQNFSWNAYGIEGQSSPASGYQFLRDNNGTGTWQVLVNTGALATTDPNYASYPNGRWRVDALGFSCTTGVNRYFGGVNEIMGAINTSRSNIKSPTSIGLNELNNKLPVKVYPNPASTQFVVEFPSMSESAMIEVRNALGQIVYKQLSSQLKNVVSCDQLEPGIYFVHVQSGKGRAVHKITLQ